MRLHMRFVSTEFHIMMDQCNNGFQMKLFFSSFHSFSLKFGLILNFLLYFVSMALCKTVQYYLRKIACVNAPLTLFFSNSTSEHFSSLLLRWHCQTCCLVLKICLKD